MPVLGHLSQTDVHEERPSYKQGNGDVRVLVCQREKNKQIHRNRKMTIKNQTKLDVQHKTLGFKDTNKTDID